MAFDEKVMKSLILTFLFVVSSLGSSLLVVPASASTPAPLAAKPLSVMEANWAYPSGNQFAWNFNPQTQINSSNAQFLGIKWLFPLPTHPAALLSVSGGLGEGPTPILVNGTIYAVTNFNQVFALNADNGNVIWTDILPITPNSTLGHYVGTVRLHMHNGHVQYTTQLFNHTPTIWIAAGDNKVYAVSAIDGKYELNFSVFDGVKTVQGDNPGAIQTGPSMILVDQHTGILISSEQSGSSAATGRCFFRGWDVTVNPPKLLWTAFCTPPQPGGNLSVDPNWEINQVNSMKGAQIFYPGPQYNQGGSMPGTAVVDLKTLSSSVLNSTLYNDWGYVNQSPECQSFTGGGPTGSTAAGWGGPWVLGTGPTAGIAFVNTNNKDPYNSPCNPGPDLWSAAVLALNETNGNWVWGFQTAAHEEWDFDCSWWQGLGNETVGASPTQVLWKICKNGYLYELNAQNGKMIWAWTAPLSVEPRCPTCFMHNPLNRTQMTTSYFDPSKTGAGQASLMYPGLTAAESESAYSPTLNYVYVSVMEIPSLCYYIAPNSTNYKGYSGLAYFPPPGAVAFAGTQDNATIAAINAATGQMVWSSFIAHQGYRGGLATSGNVVYVTLSSGDMLMLDAAKGTLIRDMFIGGPLNETPSIGATASGQMELIVPITAGPGLTWGTAVPGDLVALSLQSLPAAAPTNTVTATTTVAASVSTTTSVTTVTASATSSGVNSTTLYGVVAVAVILAISTGYLAMTRGRKPAS